MVENRIRIFDTTLRGGEQSPSAAVTLREKIGVAEFLDAMGVDIIEAAYVNALNRLLVKREKQEPEAITVAR